MNNKGLFMCYAGWQLRPPDEVGARDAGALAKKISMRKASSSFLSWLAFILERKHQAVALRIFAAAKYC